MGNSNTINTLEKQKQLEDSFSSYIETNNNIQKEESNYNNFILNFNNIIKKTSPFQSNTNVSDMKLKENENNKIVVKSKVFEHKIKGPYMKKLHFTEDTNNKNRIIIKNNIEKDNLHNMNESFRIFAVNKNTKPTSEIDLLTNAYQSGVNNFKTKNNNINSNKDNNNFINIQESKNNSNNNNIDLKELVIDGRMLLNKISSNKLLELPEEKDEESNSNSSNDTIKFFKKNKRNNNSSKSKLSYSETSKSYYLQETVATEIAEKEDHGEIIKDILDSNEIVSDNDLFFNNCNIQQTSSSKTNKYNNGKDIYSKNSSRNSSYQSYQSKSTRKNNNISVCYNDIISENESLSKTEKSSIKKGENSRRVMFKLNKMNKKINKFEEDEYEKNLSPTVKINLNYKIHSHSSNFDNRVLDSSFEEKANPFLKNKKFSSSDSSLDPSKHKSSGIFHFNHTVSEKSTGLNMMNRFMKRMSNNSVAKDDNDNKEEAIKGKFSNSNSSFDSNDSKDSRNNTLKIKLHPVSLEQNNTPFFSPNKNSPVKKLRNNKSNNNMDSGSPIKQLNKYLHNLTEISEKKSIVSITANNKDKFNKASLNINNSRLSRSRSSNNSNKKSLNSNKSNDNSSDNIIFVASPEKSRKSDTKNNKTLNTNTDDKINYTHLLDLNTHLDNHTEAKNLLVKVGNFNISKYTSSKINIEKQEKKLIQRLKKQRIISESELMKDFPKPNLFNENENLQIIVKNNNLDVTSIAQMFYSGNNVKANNSDYYLLYEYLQRLPYLKDVIDDKKTVNTLISKMKYCILEKDKFLSKEGCVPLYLFFLKKGIVNEYRNSNGDKPTNTYKAQCFFGESSLINETIRLETYKAEETCYLYILNKTIFTDLLRELNFNSYKEEKSLLINNNSILKNLNTLGFISKMYKFEYYYGDQVIRKNDFSLGLYIIAEGELEVRIPGAEKIKARNGELMGIMYFFGSKLRTVDVYTSKATTVYYLSFNAIRSCIGNDYIRKFQNAYIKSKIDLNPIFCQISKVLTNDILDHFELEVYYQEKSLIFKKNSLLNENLVIVIQGELIDDSNNPVSHIVSEVIMAEDVYDNSQRKFTKDLFNKHRNFILAKIPRSRLVYLLNDSFEEIKEKVVKQEFIKNIKLFSNLSPFIISLISQVSYIEEYEPETIIIKETDKCEDKRKKFIAASNKSLMNKGNNVSLNKLYFVMEGNMKNTIEFCFSNQSDNKFLKDDKYPKSSRGALSTKKARFNSNIYKLGDTIERDKNLNGSKLSFFNGESHNNSNTNIINNLNEYNNQKSIKLSKKVNLNVYNMRDLHSGRLSKNYFSNSQITNIKYSNNHSNNLSNINNNLNSYSNVANSSLEINKNSSIEKTDKENKFDSSFEQNNGLSNNNSLNKLSHRKVNSKAFQSNESNYNVTLYNKTKYCEVNYFYRVLEIIGFEWFIEKQIINQKMEEANMKNTNKDDGNKKNTSTSYYDNCLVNNIKIVKQTCSSLNFHLKLLSIFHKDWERIFPPETFLSAYINKKIQYSKLSTFTVSEENVYLFINSNILVLHKKKYSTSSINNNESSKDIANKESNKDTNNLEINLLPVNISPNNQTTPTNKANMILESPNNMKLLNKNKLTPNSNSNILNINNAMNNNPIFSNMRVRSNDKYSSPKVLKKEMFTTKQLFNIDNSVLEDGMIVIDDLTKIEVSVKIFSKRIIENEILYNEMSFFNELYLFYSNEEIQESSKNNKLLYNETYTSDKNNYNNFNNISNNDNISNNSNNNTNNKKINTYTNNNTSNISDSNSQKINSPFIPILLYFFESDFYFIQIFEKFKGKDLYTILYIEEYNTNYEIACFWSACLLLAVKKIHDLDFIHRNIKPENIIINDKGYPMIARYEVITLLHNHNRFKTSSVKGTPHYMAPEIILNSNGYSFSVDYWSVGVCLYEFICKSFPFANDYENPKEVYSAILNEDLTFPSYVENEEYMNCVKKMLSKNTHDRCYTFEQIIRLPFFSKVNWERLENLLVESPYIPDITKCYENNDQKQFIQLSEMMNNKHLMISNTGTKLIKRKQSKQTSLINSSAMRVPMFRQSIANLQKLK